MKYLFVRWMIICGVFFPIRSNATDNPDRLFKEIQRTVQTLSCPANAIHRKPEPLTCTDYNDCRRSLSTYISCTTSLLPFVDMVGLHSYLYGRGLLRGQYALDEMEKYVAQNHIRVEATSVTKDYLPLLFVKTQLINKINDTFKHVGEKTCEPFSKTMVDTYIFCGVTTTNSVHECNRIISNYVQKNPACPSDNNENRQLVSASLLGELRAFLILDQVNAHPDQYDDVLEVQPDVAPQSDQYESTTFN